MPQQMLDLTTMNASDGQLNAQVTERRNTYDHFLRDELVDPS